MKRKTKLFLSLVSLCFTIAILCFGVYSALSVTYTLSGSVSYELSDVFVDIETKLYLSTSSSLTNSTTLESKISEFETTLPNAASETIMHSTYSDSYSSSTSDALGKEEDSHTSSSLPINYGAYQADTSAYAYYIVVKIQNLADNTINAVLNLGDTSNLNSIIDVNHNSTNIQGRETIYFVIGMALDDATISVNNQTFSYEINISTGEIKTPILYAESKYQEIQSDNPVLLSSYGSSNTETDITSQSLTQQIESTEVENVIQVGLAKYTLSLQQDLLQDMATISFDISSSVSFNYAFVVEGVNVDANDIVTIAGEYMDGNNDGIIGGFVQESNEGVDSASIKLDVKKLFQSTNFTIILASQSEIKDITVSNAVALVVQPTSWKQVNDFDISHYIITNGNAQDNYYSYDYVEDGQSMTLNFFFQNFRIENLAPDYTLTIYLDYRFDDSWGFTFPYKGNCTPREMLDSSTEGKEPEGVTPLSISEAYEPLFIKSSDTENGVFEFCIFSMFFLTYENVPNFPLLHICVNNEPIAAEQNEDNGYTVRFIEDTETYTVPTSYNGQEINGIYLYGRCLFNTLILPNTLNSIKLITFTRKGYITINTLVLEQGMVYGELQLSDTKISVLEVRDVSYANKIKSSDIYCSEYESFIPTIKVKCSSLDEITNAWLKSSAFTQPTQIVSGYAIFVPVQ